MQISTVKTPNLEDSLREAPITESTEGVSGDAQETANSAVFVMSDPERQRLVDKTFEEIQRKYGKALSNLAK